MATITNEEKRDKLNLLLSKIQKEQEQDEFIYGMTNRTKRPLVKRINDFLIDHSRIPTKEKTYFFELLATMLQAGIPINKALKILVAKTENQRLRRIISTLSYELETGRTFSQTLDRFPEIFEEQERGVIQSAEAIGNLEQMLFKIAGNLNRHNELVMKLKSAFVYPITVMIALMVGVTVLLVFVVPRIKEIFAESSIKLPFTTQVLLGSSSFLTKSWWIIVVLMILAIIFFHIYVNSEEGKFIWDFKKLRIPVIGSLLRKIFVLRFLDTFGLLIDSGLPINKALQFTANSIGNDIYRLKIFEAIGYVQEGQKLSSSLATAPFLFPESVVNMIAVGEQAASIGEVSQKVGAQYQREIDFSLRNMTTVLGPTLILVIGIAVAFFALAVLSPIFSLTQIVK